LSDSPAYEKRDEQTKEDIEFYNDTHNGPGYDEGALVDTPPSLDEQLKTLDEKFKDNQNDQTYLKDRLDLLAKLMRERRGR